MSGPFTASLLAYLSTLPAGTNPFRATIGWYLPQITPPKYSDGYQRLIIAFAVLFALQTTLLLWACVALALAKGSWFFRITREGIWQTNARLGYGLGCLGFCAANTASLVRQALINDGKLTYHNRIALEGLRWIPLWLAGWYFVYGCVANIVSSRMAITSASIAEDEAFLDGQIPVVSAARVPKQQSRAPVYTLNALCVAVPVIVIASVSVVFAVSNRHLDSLILVASSTAVTLSAASTTYRSGEDYATVLAPFLPQIENIATEAQAMQKYWTVGFALWSAYLVALVVFVTPHFFRHLALLRRLMGTPSNLAALVPSRHRHGTSSRSHSRKSSSTSSEAAKTAEAVPLAVRLPFSSPTTPSLEKSPQTDVDDQAVAVPTLASQPGHPAGRVPTAIKPSEELRSEYRKLFISGVVIYLGFLLYAPLAVWSAVTSLEARAFWLGEIPWADLGYVITSGCFANIIFLFWPAWKVSRERLGCGGRGGAAAHRRDQSQTGSGTGSSPAKMVRVVRTTDVL